MTSTSENFRIRRNNFLSKQIYTLVPIIGLAWSTCRKNITAGMHLYSPQATLMHLLICWQLLPFLLHILRVSRILALLMESFARKFLSALLHTHVRDYLEFVSICDARRDSFAVSKCMHYMIHHVLLAGRTPVELPNACACVD